MILSLSDSILNEIYGFVRGYDHFIHQATSPDYKDMLLRIIKLRYSDLSNKILFHIDNREKIEDTFHAIQDTTTSIYSNGISYENYFRYLPLFNEMVCWYHKIKYGWINGDTVDANKADCYIHFIMRALGWPAANWNVSRSEDLSLTFIKCTHFNEDISGWDVSNVRKMNFTFAFCEHFNQDLSSWDASNAHQFSGMFWGAS